MSKKLKGHKPACKCVGCSAATRARGMAKLGLSKGRKHKNARKAHRGPVKRLRVKALAKRFKKKLKKAARVDTRRHRKATKKHANPSSFLIGTSPVMHTSRGRFAYKGARLITGPGEHCFSIIGGKAHRHPAPGVKVSCIDYRHDAKALRSYGRIAPFRHRFSSAASVKSSGTGRIVVQSSARIWEKQ